MHTYDDDCDLSWATLIPQIWDQMDHYYIIHWVDFYLASFVLRDVPIVWLWSIMTEVMELTWQHIMPHFRECWWDHVIMDILLSNTPAIIFGVWTVRKLGIEEYDWMGRQGKKSIKEWEIFHW